MAVTFTRNSTAYKKDGTHVNTNQPRFEGGRFGQAVMGEEGTTNLLPEAVARCEEGLSSNNSAFGTITFDSTFGRSSAPSARYEHIAEGRFRGYFTGSFPATAGLVYTHSIYVFSTMCVVTPNFEIVWGSADGTDISTSRSRPTNDLGQWTRFVVTDTAPAETTHMRALMSSGTVAVGDILWFDDLQLEQKAYPTSWHEAVRAVETLTVPTATALSPMKGTIEFWWTPVNQPSETIVGQFSSPPIIEVGTYAQNNSWILWLTNWGLRLLGRGDSATGWTLASTVIPNLNWFVLNQPVHFAVNWVTGDTFNVFVDGVRYGPFVSSLPLTGIAGNVMSLGRWRAASGLSNAFYDDIRISSVARTDAEILSGFNSGKPLPVDMDTTAKYLFDNTLDAVKQTSAGSSAAVGITTQGAGSKQARAGSATTLATTAQGAGLKQARAGSATTLATTSQGVGSKRGQGGSFATLGISAQGWGYKLLRRIIRLVGTLREKIKLKGVL